MVTFFDELKPRNTKHMNHLWYIVPITIAGYTRRYIMYIPTWEYVLGRYMPIYVATYTLYLHILEVSLYLHTTHLST